ncbi:hypothetical protein [Hoeflea sp.]|uniref:hypothetical protein n=1 Tax=Hoeflea sp. TaxID=1940281 RepID=UPI00374A0243
MAEPGKSKRPSPGKKAPEPDFSPFRDWLVDGPAGKWPKPWEVKKALSPKQKRIVARNAALLLDRDAWLKKVQAFEAALSALADEAKQKAKRAEYCIRFDGHNFSDGAKDFSDYRFPCTVLFNCCKFGDVSFRWAKFSDGDVSFERAKFGDGKVHFDGAIFGNCDVSFNRAEFGTGEFSLTRTQFGIGPVSFWKSDRISKSISASGMSVAGDLYVEADFSEAVDFSRLDVKGTARFSGSSFAKVPDFTGAKFDRPPEVAGMVVPRPKLEGRSQLAADRNDVAKFRKLKAMALAANDHERDGEFFAGEMLAKRGTETTSAVGLLFNTVYWKISDFGQSFTLPLWLLFGSFLAFAFANFVVLQSGISATSVTSAARVDAFVFSAFLSLKNSVPLLGSLFRFAQAPEKHKSWFQTYYDTLLGHQSTVDWLIGLGVAQNILGGVLLFLFLLALRNKFRLK